MLILMMYTCTCIPKDYGNKRTTLYDIRDELFSPYKERRRPYQPLSPEEKFSLLTGTVLDHVSVLCDPNYLYMYNHVHVHVYQMLHIHPILI